MCACACIARYKLSVSVAKLCLLHVIAFSRLIPSIPGRNFFSSPHRWLMKTDVNKIIHDAYFYTLSHSASCASVCFLQNLREIYSAVFP